MRYFINLAYRGARFHGWQRQPNDNSVQEAVEDALSKILRQQVAITGAGRTDTGVNARVMPAHLDLDMTLDDGQCRDICRALNAICRPDIVASQMVAVNDDAHARFDAIKRTYRYFVHVVPNPFIYPLSWQAPAGLDFELMNQAADTLLGTQDFTSFSKLHTDTKTNICTVTQARWVEFEPSRWYFEISADRFLRNMVRAVTGTLIDIGRHKFSSGHIADVLALKDRCAAGTSMPPHPLFLWDVIYPYPTFSR